MMTIPVIYGPKSTQNAPKTEIVLSVANADAKRIDLLSNPFSEEDEKVAGMSSMQERVNEDGAAIQAYSMSEGAKRLFESVPIPIQNADGDFKTITYTTASS